MTQQTFKQFDSSRRGGAVIIVVISLMITLMFLGIFFFNFVRQERTNAEFHAATDPLEIDPDAVFDFGLRQVIVSTPADRTNSALFSNIVDSVPLPVSFWSLLAHELGPINSQGMAVDSHPLNGGGITLRFNDISPTDGIPDMEIDTDGDATNDYPGFYFDYLGNGSASANYQQFVLNYSAAANGGAALNNVTGANFIFSPDAGYTYPDMNSLFLAMDYDYLDPGPPPAPRIRVVKPSFTLPGFFPVQRRNAVGFTNIYSSAGTATINPNQSMRPHELHVSAPGVRRYLNAPTPAQSGNTNRFIEPYDFAGGTWGVWQGTTNYSLDRDLDGDGVDDSIDMDLDHPLIELPGGRQVVPIFQWKIEELDGLLNANVHGQMPLVMANSNLGTADLYSQVYNSPDWVHYSHQGLSPAEVNPEYALYADPQDAANNYVEATDRTIATAPHRGYVAQRHDGTSPVDPPVDRTGGPTGVSRLQAANLELAMMLFGRPEIETDDPVGGTSALYYASTVNYIGRYGNDAGTLRLALEQGGLVAGAGILSSPGALDPTTGLDDDDGNDGTLANTPASSYVNTTNGFGGRAFQDPRLGGVAIPPFVHPLDYTGMGDNSATNGATYRRSVALVYEELGERLLGPIATTSGGLSPVRWPQYPAAGIWQDQGDDSTTVLGGAATYSSLGFQTLLGDGASGSFALQPASQDLLRNNANEMQLYRAPGAFDAPFSSAEIAALQLSNSDWYRSGGDSRLRKLLPLNFEYNKQADRIRSQFTTESWDRLELSFAPFPHATLRQWEFNNNGKFPPVFAGALASEHEVVDPGIPGSYDGAISALDPFRPEVRRLLTVDAIAGAWDRSQFPQQRLQLNRILSDDTLPSLSQQPAFDASGNPQFRNLVPHVVDGTSLTVGSTLEAMIHDNLDFTTITTVYPATHPVRRFDEIATDPLVQEWWARYDRQRLARDIYVLLYTLSGNDGTNPDWDAATNPTSTPVDAAQARDMAQFAVNVVDAMDRDNVITKFVYDENLSDGWDSNPSLAVYGVERQELVFHEALLIKVLSQASDSSTTIFDETNDDHRFLYIELRNVSPFPVELRSHSWRIVRLDTSSGSDVEQISAEFRSVSGNGKIVPPGENYLIACHDGTVLNGNGQAIGSEFYVDFQAAGELECAVPKGVAPVNDNLQQPTNVIDMDLTAFDDGAGSDDKYVQFSAPIAPYDGATLVQVSLGGGSPVDAPVTFSLQRRLNPMANGVGEEWVEMDRIHLDSTEIKEFNPAGDTQGDNITALQGIKSRERLHHFTYRLSDHPGAAEQNHSMDETPANKHLANQALIDAVSTTSVPIDSAADLRVWQPHFDRDFTSVYDLLSIPIYGPRSATDTTPIPSLPFPLSTGYDRGGVLYNLVDNSSLAGTVRLAGYRTAQSRFLFPDPTMMGTLGHPFDGKPHESYVNRWYRLFGFVGIPPSADDVMENGLALIRRTPGRVNLNTLRHEAVLAGLLDDDVHLDGVSNVLYPTTDKTSDGLDRNWMREFLFARDREPVSVGGTDVPLPGTPLSRPFVPAARIDTFQPEDSVDGTLMRFGGLNPSSGRASELAKMELFEARPTTDLAADGDLVDYHTRQRLLSKIANNTTERSHVYAIWAGFDLHEAHTTAAGAVQIGARAEDLPRYRLFCVVDMSRLEEAYTDPDGTGPLPGTFDFRKFIIHRQLLP